MREREGRERERERRDKEGSIYDRRKKKRDGWMDEWLI